MMTFTTDFLRAVVDALLPGLPESDSAAALPAASAIGVDQQLADHLANDGNREALSQVLQAVATLAGDMGTFVAADEETATAIVREVESTEAAAFQTLLFAIAADYYENEHVLRAFGWSTEPPQPQGYRLQPMNEDLLSQVKVREQLWRS